MLEGIRAFADDGGKVIYLIAFVVFIIWTMVFERAVFILRFSRTKESVAAGIIKKSGPTASARLREMARLSQSICHPMSFIRSLIAVCPLLGLLGTVTGMMELFDSISFFGTGNSRAILSAVSHTTIPTMAGMVAALFGAGADIVLRHYAKIHLDGVKRLVVA